MRRIKVGVLFPHLILGGGETATMEVADGLQDLFNVHICALDRRRATVERTIREELTDRFEEVTFVREIEELTAVLEAVDVLLWYGTNQWTPGVLEALSRRPASIRIVHTDKKEEGVEFCRRWRHCIDAVACVSPVVQRLIPASTFTPNTASPRNLKGEKRRFFSEGNGRPTLAFVGRLFHFKNVDWLIDNLRWLECNLLVQGLDTTEMTVEDLKGRAERHGVSDRVRFLPPGRDVGTILRSADAVAIVSRHEGFPMVAVEAGMVGAPLIATRVGALPELFPDQILFVESENGVPLLNDMKLSIARTGPDWGIRLRVKTERICSKQAVVARYAGLIRSTLKERRV